MEDSVPSHAVISEGEISTSRSPAMRKPNSNSIQTLPNSRPLAYNPCTGRERSFKKANTPTETANTSNITRLVSIRRVMPEHTLDRSDIRTGPSYRPRDSPGFGRIRCAHEQERGNRRDRSRRRFPSDESSVSDILQILCCVD